MPSFKATAIVIGLNTEPNSNWPDIERLLNILGRLVETGNTVVVIEHNMDVIKNCDWIIDLGPEGGDGGGQLVAQGDPESIKQNKKSYTGKFLLKYLNT